MRRKKTGQYLGEKVESHIIEYNVMVDGVAKSDFYEKYIHAALDKLVENVIHKYKFYYYESTYEDLKHETVVYLHERLPKFTSDKGKAFSYFTVVARNYLIVRTTKTYERLVAKDSLDIVDESRNIMNEVLRDEYSGLLSDFCKEWSGWGIDNVEHLFERNRDQRVAEAVFKLFGTVDDIDNYNKKALYILIRDHSNVKTQYITKVVKDLKLLFKRMLGEYMSQGVIDWNGYLYERRVEQ